MWIRTAQKCHGSPTLQNWKKLFTKVISHHFWGSYGIIYEGCKSSGNLEATNGKDTLFIPTSSSSSSSPSSSSAVASNIWACSSLSSLKELIWMVQTYKLHKRYKIPVQELYSWSQCYGSGIRWLFDPGSGKGFLRIPDSLMAKLYNSWCFD